MFFSTACAICICWLWRVIQFPVVCSSKYLIFRFLLLIDHLGIVPICKIVYLTALLVCVDGLVLYLNGSWVVVDM